MWRGMVREGAVRRCRGGDSYSPLGENCYCGLNFARGASALNNKGKFERSKGFFFICCMFCMNLFDFLTGKQEILVRIFVVYLSLR